MWLVLRYPGGAAALRLAAAHAAAPEPVSSTERLSPTLPAAGVDGLLRGVGLVLFGVGLTWLLTVVLSRAVTRRGLAFWVWDRSGAIGRVLIAVGFGLCVLGLCQNGSSVAGGSSLRPLEQKF